MQHLHILGVDPGGTTGLARLHVGEEGPWWQIAEQVRDKEMFSWLDHAELPDVVVVEDFIARPKLTDGRWTELPTAKLIGAIEYWAHTKGVRFILQQPSCKPVGYAKAGLEYKKGKQGTHMQDAMAHAAFYASKIGYQTRERK